jgi:hypothetical protein
MHQEARQRRLWKASLTGYPVKRYSVRVMKHSNITQHISVVVALHIPFTRHSVRHSVRLPALVSSLMVLHSLFRRLPGHCHQTLTGRIVVCPYPLTTYDDNLSTSFQYPLQLKQDHCYVGNFDHGQMCLQLPG